MTVSNELMLAILAMDSYNRGYDAGIGDGQNVVDSVDTDGLGEAGSTIGNAAVIDVDLPLGSEAAGFYAIAYQWNGETVISYRGTDNPNPLAEGSDFWNGWTLGAGFRSCRRRRHRHRPFACWRIGWGKAARHRVNSVVMKYSSSCRIFR